MNTSRKSLIDQSDNDIKAALIEAIDAGASLEDIEKVASGTLTTHLIYERLGKYAKALRLGYEVCYTLECGQTH